MNCCNHNHHKNDPELNQCLECGLHYKDKEQAKKCEEWCREYQSCNLEITSNAVENKSP